MHSHVIKKLRELRKQRVADSEIVENLKLTEIYDKVEICKHYNKHSSQFFIVWKQSWVWFEQL